MSVAITQKHATIMLNTFSQPINFDGADKGKGRATGIVGLSPEPLEPAHFALPSLATACQHSAEHWPTRISPGNLPTPRPYQAHSTIGVVLSAETGEQLGDLVLKLIEWMIEPPVIDLTLEEFGSNFQPPPHTTAVPISGRMPSDVLVLIAENTTYSMYVQSVPSIKSDIEIHSPVVRL